MKNFTILLAVLLAGCVGAGNATPTPTPIASTDLPSQTPEPTAMEAAEEASEATPGPLPLPTQEEAGLPPYPASQAATDQSPYPAPAQANDSPYPAPGQETIRLRGMDDLPMAGTLFLPDEAPQPWGAVLLLHMLGSDQEAWGDVPARLADAGYVVLAIDMRGHGKTGGEIDWDKAEGDHQIALDFLSNLAEVDSSRMAIIGASIGSNLALRAGAENETVRAVALLSPGLDYEGVTTEQALAAFGDRPLLIVASREDTYSADSSESLASQALGDARLEMLEGAGHGTNMLAGQPGLVDTILDWLDQAMN